MYHSDTERPIVVRLKRAAKHLEAAHANLVEAHNMLLQEGSDLADYQEQLDERAGLVFEDYQKVLNLAQILATNNYGQGFIDPHDRLKAPRVTQPNMGQRTSYPVAEIRAYLERATWTTVEGLAVMFDMRQAEVIQVCNHHLADMNLRVRNGLIHS